MSTLTFAGVPIRVCPYMRKDSIILVGKNGPKPIVYVDNESMADTLVRALNGDPEYAKKCSTIVEIGEI